MLVERAIATCLLAGALCASACYRPSNAPRRSGGPRSTCPQPDTGARSRWRHRVRGAATSSLYGEPHHSANDPVLNPGGDAIVRGKFAYGAVSKDLEHEEVSLWLEMRPCGGWAEIARKTTDGKGRVALTVPARLIPTPGAYRFQLVVSGDLSRTGGTIFVLEPGTQTVVFDIDGTLTTGDGQLVEQLALGWDPDVRPGAAAVARLYARAGYLPVYISGRPYMLRDATRDWLRRYGFPRGIVITTDAVGEGLPGEGRVGDFKQRWLDALGSGPRLAFAAAYGNAKTDVCAYARAGIDPYATFIIGKHGGLDCPGFAATQPLDDLREHLRHLAAMPPAR